MAIMTRKRLISGADTVAVFSDWNGEWTEQWRGKLYHFLSENAFNSPGEVLPILADLERGEDHHTGGGAAPDFIVRLVAQAL